MVKVFFSISSSMTFSQHSFNWELILNNTEFYSLTVLKSVTSGASSHIKLSRES